MYALSRSKQFFILCLMALLSACSGERNKGEVTDFKALEYLGQIDQLNDTTFLSDAVFHLTVYGDTLAMADSKQGKVFFCTKDGRLLGSIGRKGEGPGEFLGLKQFVRLDDSTCFMRDTYKNKMAYYTNEHCERELQDREPGYFTRICRLGDDLYFYEKNFGGQLCRMNLGTDSVSFFGHAQDFEFKDITAVRNQRHVVTDGKYLYAARVDRPIVEKYTTEGEWVQTLDLSYKPIFKQIIEEDAIASSNSWPCVGIDIYPVNGKLYYLVGFQIDDKHRGSDKLVVITTDGSQMQVESLHSLSEGWYYSTLAVSGDELYAFEWAQGVMHKYKL